MIGKKNKGVNKWQKKDIKKLAELTNNDILSEDDYSIEMTTSGYVTILFLFDGKTGQVVKIIA